MTETTEKTGQELLAYLKDTGTGYSRLEMVQAYLTKHSRATAPEVLEHLITERQPPGTIDKVGKWLYGPTYSYTNPDQRTPTLDEETKRLREQLAQAQQENRELNGRNHALLKENMRLRKIADVKTAQEPELRSKSFEETKPGKRREPALAGT